jgi:uncharacterized protein (DUF736 family)
MNLDLQHLVPLGASCDCQDFEPLHRPQGASLRFATRTPFQRQSLGSSGLGPPKRHRQTGEPKETAMIIGKFTTSGTKFEGFICTLSGEVGITLTPAPTGADYIVTTDGGCEVGADWHKTSKRGDSYISVRLDGQFLSAPIHAAMFVQKDGSHSLVWQRQAEED